MREGGPAHVQVSQVPGPNVLFHALPSPLLGYVSNPQSASFAPYVLKMCTATTCICSTNSIVTNFYSQPWTRRTHPTPCLRPPRRVCGGLAVTDFAIVTVYELLFAS